MRTLFVKNLKNQGKNSKIFSKAFLLVFSLILLKQANAATFNSKGDGAWTNSAVWQKTGTNSPSTPYPIAGDVVIIEKGDIIVADGNIQIGTLTINGPNNAKSYSGLSLGTYTLTVGDINLLGNNNDNKKSEISVTTGSIIVSGNINKNATGVLTLDAASTVNFNGNGSTQNVPAFTYGKLQFNGTASKKLEGDLTINTKVLTSLQINGPLDLNYKMLDATSATVVMQQTGEATNANVTGYLKLAPGSKMTANNVGSTTVVFPVGTDTYTPAYITNSGTPNSFSVRLTNGVVDHMDKAVISRVVNKTWDVACENQVGTVNVTLKLQWNVADETSGFTRSSCAVSHFDNSIRRWTNKQDFSPAENGVGGTFTRSMSNITSFSPFAVGDAGSPLPVSLTYFKAAKTENGTALTWETASEKNNKGYDVQASTDGKNFETVAFVASKNGNANYSQRYEFLDKTSRSGLVYYRLKQTDFDGTVAYYAAKVVDLGKFAESAVVYPNPFQNQFEVKLNGATSLEVTDLTGKVVYRGQIAPGTNNLNIDMNNQPAGLYLLKASAAGKTTITRLVKQ